MLARLLALMSMTTAAVAAPPQPRQPTGLWNVDYGSSQCTATRSYGTSEKPLYLVFKPSPLGGVMRLAIVGKGRIAVAQHEGKLAFDGRSSLPVGILTYTDDRRKNQVASVNLPMADFRANQEARSLSIQGGPVSEAFALSKLPQVTAELEKCLRLLQQKWKIDGGERANRVSKEAAPKKPLNRYFSAGDYPWPALRDNQSGIVNMVILVDEKGGISDCSVNETSGVPSLDAMSCYVLQSRAKFDPAIGPDGKPTASAYCQRVRWRTDWAGGRKEDPGPLDRRCPEQALADYPR